MRPVAALARALSVVALALGLAWPAAAFAAQGNQGLQGGWAIDDGGNVNFFHSASSQFPIMQSAGAGWVRVNFRLGECFQNWTISSCRSDGQTALQVYETVVTNARAKNLKVLGLLSNEAWHGNQPDWTANNAENTAGGTGDNAYIQAFAQSAAGPLAGKFDGTHGPLVDAWEVWNEPNAWTSNPAPGVFQGSSYIYPSNFAWLLKRSKEAIKAARPGGVVISGGLFAHDPGGAAMPVSENGMTRRAVKRGDQPGARRPATASVSCTSSVPSGADYLCLTYQMGISKAGWQAGSYPFDQVGQHLYVDQGRTTSSTKLKSHLQDLRNAYVAYEGSTTAKKTHVTEVGWATPPVSASVQSQNLKTAYTTFRRTSYVGRAYWFNVQDIPEGGLYFGLVDSNGVNKAAFKTYQSYAVY